MKTFSKILTSFALAVFVLFNLTGCYDAVGIEEFAYIVALGIDINDNNELELTVQIATSQGSSSGDSSGSSSQSKETNITTLKCESIESGLSLINNHISKKINLSNCQVVLISEKVAYNGLSEYVDTLINNVELKNDCSIIITKCTAKEYIENVNPSLENLTARYYEFTLNSAKYTGYTVNITLFEFYSKMKDTSSEAYAILGTVVTKNDINNPEKLNANYIAGNNPIKDKDLIDNLGIAVFDGDKLVGELTGLDSLCHVMVNNELKECIISVPSPFEEHTYIDLGVTSEKKPRCSVTLINSSPLINVEVYLLAKGLSLDEKINYDSKESIDLIEQYAETYIANQISSYLYKTAKNYNSDICGFGKYTKKNYLTLDEWSKLNWSENYKDSFFNVQVNLNIKSGNLFNKS